MRNLNDALAAIDQANAGDPNRRGGQPLARVQGRLATRWLERLVDEPSESLALAVRAHHLKRWELARADYPEGRAGYLRWRRDNKAHQAAEARALATEHGYEPAAADRVGELLERRRLGTDPETQVLEDAACLVFLETQFDDMIRRLDHDQLVRVVAKTLKKMSPEAIGLARTITLSGPAHTVLAEAAAQE